MLYRILENTFQDNAVEFVPQYKIGTEATFYGGEQEYKNFIERGANGMHTIIKYATYNEALSYITAQKHLSEKPVTSVVHIIE